MFIRWLNYRRLHDSLAGIQETLGYINQRIKSMSASIDDLNAAVTDLTTASSNYTAAVAAEIAAIEAANGKGSNDVAIEVAVGNLKILTDSFSAATTAAQAATNPTA